MKNKTGLQWCGFAFVSIVGTLWHFIYQWTGDNRLAALVCPVNESPWEHLKLLWFPFLLWCLIILRSTKGQSGAWARHCVGALTGIGVITAFFFTYKGIIGRYVMALDIISFILGVGSAFWIDAYIFFGFTTNLSSKYIVKANNINVTSCALAAIKSFNKYKSSNTNISDVNLFFVSLELEKYIAIPNKNENIIVDI